MVLQDVAEGLETGLSWKLRSQQVIGEMDAVILYTDVNVAEFVSPQQKDYRCEGYVVMDSREALEEHWA